MKIDDVARAGYFELRRVLDSGDPDRAEEVMSRYVSSSSRLRRLWQLVRRRPSLEMLLIACCENGDLQAARMLVRFGANPYWSCGGYPSAIQIGASRQGNLALCEMLVRESRRGDLSHALVSAALANQLDIVRLLLAEGAHPNAVLRADDVVLIRVRGVILRTLIEAGGIASPAITKMLQSRTALGDG